MNSIINKILPQTTSSSPKSPSSPADQEESKSSIQQDLTPNLEQRVMDFENKSLAMVTRLDETKDLILQCIEGER